ncbi:MAG: homocysteine S-methyltransferase [Gammaproteobacteria bacterium]|nr:homocysteine S-methyltransferase [Gammaproteobacteria bacterium]MYD75595.1 homocysteine S-methyltransferase [Gammaproteobacteria bacterium]MYJ53089.1 homocysteine S-methyltransferase [Gammaproteobacteria bacterium]
MPDRGSNASPVPSWALSSLDLPEGSVVCLDGGLATELESRGFRFETPLWSAQLLIDNAGAVHDSHLAYLEAGARIITSASYQATLQGFAGQGIEPERAREMLLESVRIAKRARDDAKADTGRAALVAASIGPYGAYLADGSEYRGNYGLDADRLEHFHRERIEILDQSGADLLACETVPDYLEACALARILEEISTPSWVSFCCRDDAVLHDGTPVEAAAAIFESIEKVFAIGVNCTAPEHVPSLIGRIRSAVPDKTVVVYPNSGEHYRDGTWTGERAASRWERNCREWIECGARIVGGCCRIGPHEIRQLVRIAEGCYS